MVKISGPMALELGMYHRVPEYCYDCSNDHLRLTLTFLRKGKIWETANTLDFIERFEDFGLKINS